MYRNYKTANHNEDNITEGVASNPKLNSKPKISKINLISRETAQHYSNDDAEASISYEGLREEAQSTLHRETKD
ncbi:hypothetical protein [Psychrobacter sp. CAL346-MNA-CIBAN-0220]|uniref:hypothetical protein n=1 Tax=Psychrobacter sp. CAL346-MNA-CIBAN-0220 TaxID=3140457 RepID=UPI00333436B3